MERISLRNGTRWRLKPVLSFLLVLTTLLSLNNEVRSQVNYTQTWAATGLNGWTSQNGGFLRTTTSVCATTGSVRSNIYSTNTLGNFASPSLAGNNGGLVTMSYRYKVINWSGGAATPNTFGTLKVQYAAALAGPWTDVPGSTISTGHVPSTNCATQTVSFTPPVGALFVRFNTVWATGDYYMYFDEVSITQAVVSSCSGTPNAGTSAISSATGCGGSSQTLSASGLSVGTGITYQWQSGPSATGPWTAIGGATSASTAITTVNGTTFYRLLTTCSSSGLSNATNAVSFIGTACGSVNVPAAGSATVNCGTSTFIYDNGGSAGMYLNSSSGTVVLDNSGTGVITLSGNFATESGYDFLRIYAGSGTGGALLYSYSGTGNITTFSSAAGQPLTIQFTSDGSVQGNGFALTAIYSGTCAACSAPSALTSSAVTTTSATISWSAAAPAPASGYEYFVSTSPTAPTAGTAPTGTTAAGVTTANLTGLTPNVTYYFWVRSNCGGSGTSNWAGSANFFTGLSGCTNTFAYGTVNAPTNNVAVTINTCIFHGDYSTINSCAAGANYQISFDLGGFITIHQGTFNGPIVASGNAPLSWTAATAGTYFAHFNTNSACGTASICGTSTILCTSCAAPTPGGCNNATPFASANAPFNATLTISACQYGGEYATLSNATAATQYTSSTDMAGAYFTIRQGTPAGTIVGEGLAPLTWTSTVAGTYYIHFNTNNACGTDAVCHTNVISHTCPAVAAPTSITASPATICVGNGLNLNATAGGNAINWYTVPVGGTSIGTTASGANQAMSPTATSTYYAEALVSSTGCASATRVSVSVVVNTPSVQSALANGDVVWNGRSSSDYATINNWYQFNGTGYVNATAAPTTAQNVIIPVNQTCVLNQPNTNANTVSANNITIENSASLTMTTGTLNVAGNFLNNGTFTAGSGTVAFVGTGNNAIGGSVASNAFNNLTMNKAGEVLLDKPITIANTLALTNGRLNIAGFNLDMAANTVTGGSGSSYVKTSSTGEFKRNVGGSAVLFPVGRGAYNPATLTNSGTADNYGIRVVDNVADNGNNADAGPTTGLPVVNRTWMIDEAITGGSNVTLKLVWNGAGEGINGFDPIANTPFIAHYESGAGMWDNMGGNVVAVGAIEQSGFTSFSPFTISTSGTFAPLPIELVSFQANCADNNRVNVTWSTASEHNTSYFIIEKSRDGQNWKELATVPAAGNSTELLNYSVMDTEAGDGLNYYRMTQFDNDGENEMFDPTTSNCSEEPQTVVKTYPNPSDESFFFMINTEEITGEGTLTITDAKGTVVFMQSVVVEKGNNVFHINDFQVLPGVYFVQVSNGTASKVIMHSIR